MISLRPAICACITEAAGLGDVAGLLQPDVPRRAAHASVGVAEGQLAAADGDLVLRRGRQLSDDAVLVRGIDERRQVARARLVLARQPGRLDVVRVVHAEFLRLAVHRRDERRQATRIVAPEGVGGAVLRRHQREVEHVLRLAGCPRRAAVAALLGVDVVLRDHEHLVQRQLRLGHDQRRHQLGDRRNRQHRLRVLGEQDLPRILVHHQRDARLQVQRIGSAVQTVELAERGLGRGDARRWTAALCARCCRHWAPSPRASPS